MPLIIDQQNPGPFSRTDSAVANPGGPAITVGQSATPLFSAIDAMEFYLRPSSLFPSTTAMVQLRDGLVGSDGLGGLILAASGSVTLPAGSPEGFYRFEFPHWALTPLQTYVAELVVTEGGLDLGTNQDNPYAGGQSLSKGLPSFILAPTTDQVFREGVYAVSVPVPGAVLLGMLGLGFAGLRLRRVS